jgi:mono/diheme cytochrome c family protein
LKNSSLILPATSAALLAVVLFATNSLAQTAQTVQLAPAQPSNASAAPHEDHDHAHPAPTNLKVLPKTLTGDQVHELMEQWEAALDAHCNTCHTPDLKNIGPNGRPRLNFADDSKSEKAAARMMYKMTEDINKNYVSMIDSSGAPVTCGTCHRGHLGPEPWAAPKEGSPRPVQPPLPANETQSK